MNHATNDDQSQTMTLYLLTRTDEIDHGQAEAQVIIAAHSDEARRLAMRDLSGTEQLSSLDPARSKLHPHHHRCHRRHAARADRARPLMTHLATPGGKQP